MAMKVADLTNLEQISQGRDYVLTHENARLISRAPQTVRKNYCLQGHSFGLRPVKIGNRLMWSVSDIARLLSGEVAQ